MARARTARLPWVLAMIAIFLVLAWARQIQAVHLLLAVVTLLAAALVASRRSGASLLYWAAVGMTVLGIIGALEAERRFRSIEHDWADQVVEREDRLRRVLARRMASLVERGQSAASLAAERARDTSPGALFAELEGLRVRTGIDALAVFTHGGDLLAWAGDHRGRLEEPVRLNRGGAAFAERPLYSYLYFSAPVEGTAQHVVAAVLVETGLVQDAADAGFTADFERRTGSRPSFRAGGAPDAAWSLVQGADTIVHARFDPLSQAGAREAIERAAQRGVALAGLLAFLLLAIGWMRVRPATGWLSALPLLIAIPVLLLTPVGPLLGLDRLFSPLLFLLPPNLTLGTLIVLLLPVASLVASLRMPAVGLRAGRRALVAGALAVLVSYVAAIRLFASAAAPMLLAADEATAGAPMLPSADASLWFGLQVAVVLLLTSITALAMPRRAPLVAIDLGRWAQRRAELGLLVLGIALSIVLALVVHFRLRPDLPPRAWTAGLWVAPFLLLSIALARFGGAGGRLLRWLAAGALAASAVVPHLWGAHVGARLDAADRELRTLGTKGDPYLNFLLLEFGRESLERFAAGEDGVQLLYRAWVASGMARESYPVHAVLWDESGAPRIQLGLGDDAAGDTLAAVLAEYARGAGVTDEMTIDEVTDNPLVTRLLRVPLGGEGVITVTVPPRRSLERTSVVAPFLGAVQSQDTRLNLVQARPGASLPEGTHWIRSDAGWRSEASVRYPEAEYHAHLEVRLPSVGVRLARGVLVIVFDLALLLVLWYLGSAARGAAPRPRTGWLGWAGSFRARITLALFGFFLLPTLVFGWAAYSALAGEVARAARAVAERAVAVAVLEFPDAEGDLGELAEHAGTDVLYYYRGELARVSAPEAFELGVYGAWMPPSVYLLLETGDEVSQTDTRALGDRPFLMAFRSLPAAGTLAVPMALSAGDTVVRQRELAHLVLFAALVGALLSLALSVAVGRALAGPIGQLRRASAAVGAGRLRVRLPEPAPGEFGQVFASFNRMVRRLRRARAQELRTARVLAWGEMARQIAHEIKNPLTPIKLAVQHIRRAYRDRRPDFGDILDDSVTQILAEIDRLTEIARAFSRYGAPPEAIGPLEQVDAAAVARDALTLYRKSDSRIDFSTAIEMGLPRVRARSGELKEVLLNLLENARDALDGEGHVEIQLYTLDDRVALDVVDDGPGIPPELLRRIFEPHFSTRSTGTGLGLAIVRRIVESWGGTIDVESEPGRGTIMRVRMVAADHGRDLPSGTPPPWRRGPDDDDAA